MLGPIEVNPQLTNAVGMVKEKHNLIDPHSDQTCGCVYMRHPSRSNGKQLSFRKSVP